LINLHPWGFLKIAIRDPQLFDFDLRLPAA